MSSKHSVHFNFSYLSQGLEPFEFIGISSGTGSPKKYNCSGSGLKKK